VVSQEISGEDATVAHSKILLRISNEAQVQADGRSHQIVSAGKHQQKGDYSQLK
jgi:hypothetical protein